MILRETYLLALCPDSSGMSPFKIAMDSKNVVTIEKLLQMLLKLTHYRLFTEMFTKEATIEDLMALKPPSLYDFLSSCYFQPLSIIKVKEYVYGSDAPYKAIQMKTCFMNEEFLQRKLSKRETLDKFVKWL